MKPDESLHAVLERATESGVRVVGWHEDIALVQDGVTPNDPGDADAGPNYLINLPVLTSVAGNWDRPPLAPAG